MLFSTTVLLNVMDMPFTFLTIYNVIRNQYFYLGETVLYEVPSAANFVVATFIIVEMADEGNEVRVTLSLLPRRARSRPGRSTGCG